MREANELIERQVARGALDAAVDAALRGAGSVALVQGEAGIGKTVLVRQLARERAEEARFVFGCCDALSTPRPLGPLWDIVRDWGGDELQRSLRSGDRAAVFSRVLDELHASEDALVLVLEDVHWADEATLDLVRFLGRRIEGVGALVIATFRDDEIGADHPLRAALGDLPRSAVRRVELQPLSERGVAALAGGERPDLYRITGGNPFFVTELLASAAGEVPLTVRDAVLARMFRLTARARAMAETVSVVPGRAEGWLVEAVTGSDEHAADECTTGGLLRADGHGLAFRHELARQAVLGSLPPGRRRKLHAAVLGALLARSDHDRQLARVVHHAAGAGDSATLIERAPGAARQAAVVGAHREAAAHYRTVLRFSDELPVPRRVELLEAHAYECYLTSAITEAIESRRRALELLRAESSPDRQGIGRNLRWLSRLWWFAGVRSEAERLGEEAIEMLDGLDDSEYAMACSNRAQLHMLADESESAVRWGTRAIELAERLGDQETLAHALNNTGSARLAAGDAAGREELERSLSLSIELDLQEHAARAYTNLASNAVRTFDYERGREHLDRGIAYGDERDLDSWSDYMRGWRARLALETGDWDAAARDAEVVLARPAAPTVIRLPALAALGLLRVRRGDPGGEELLEEARQLADRTAELQRIGPVACARAEAAWLRGSAGEAATGLRRAHELATDGRDRWMLGELSLWMHLLGLLDRRPAGIPRAHGHAIAGRWRAAAREWSRLGRPYERAMALAEGDEAAQREALAGFLELGAAPAAERVRRLLRERGARAIPRGPRPATRANPAGLTPRQTEVLALLAEDLSYREIAGRLFVAPKTVEHHVAAILARLGVASRDEAVAAARARGVLP